MITLQSSARYSSNFARFATSTHLLVFVQHLYLCHDNCAKLEVQALGKLLAQLPKLCSLRIFADAIVNEPNNDNDATALPRLHLVRFNASVKCVVEEDSLHALFSLFRSFDEFLLDYGLLITLRPRPLPRKLRVRHMTSSNPTRSSVTLTPSEKVSLLSRIVDTGSIESIYDPDRNCIAGAGKVDGVSWSNLRDLRLGSNYEQTIFVEGAVYPSLQSLHLGKVVVEAPQRGSAPSSRRWAILAQTLLQSPPSLEQFEFSILLLGIDELDREDEEHQPLDLQFVVRTLQSMDWSVFAHAIQSHPLLRCGKITVRIVPGCCPNSNTEVAQALNTSVPPSHLVSPRISEILCFDVE